MKISIDGLPLLGEASIATYLREMLFQLNSKLKEHEYQLFFRDFRRVTHEKKLNLSKDSEMGCFKQCSFRIPNKLLEWFWIKNNIYLPNTERMMGNPDLFLSTIYLTPVFKSTKTVMIAYDLIPFLFPEFYSKDRNKLDPIIKKGIERAEAILAISEATKRDFVRLMGASEEKIEVIYPDVDQRFKEAKKPDKTAEILKKYQIKKPYLLYTGTLGPHKNVATLVNVFRALKKEKGLPHTLVLCGKSKWGPNIMSRIADLMEEGDVKVLDFIPSEEVPHLYDGAELLLFVSLYEGFGLPPLEAMNRGVPVVASNAGSLPEVIGEAGLLSDPKNEKAIYQNILEVIAYPDLRRKLVSKGYKQANKFDWNRSVQQINQLFYKATGKRK